MEYKKKKKGAVVVAIKKPVTVKEQKTTKDEKPLDPEFLRGLIMILTKVCGDNDRSFRNRQISPVFQAYCSSNQRISIKDYILRIARYGELSEACFLTAVMYLDHLTEHHGLVLDSSCFHRLFLICCTIATKFMEDDHYDNQTFAFIGGIKDVKEFNQMEADIIFLLQFDLMPTLDRFKLYFSELSQYCIHSRKINNQRYCDDH